MLWNEQVIDFGVSRNINFSNICYGHKLKFNFLIHFAYNC